MLGTVLLLLSLLVGLWQRSSDSEVGLLVWPDDKVAVAVDTDVVLSALAAALAAAAADRDWELAGITCSMRRQAACWLQGSLVSGSSNGTGVIAWPKGPLAAVVLSRHSISATVELLEHRTQHHVHVGMSE